MHTSIPNAGDHVWIRQRRWRVDRIARERGVTRLDVSAPGAGRKTFLSPFDRPSVAAMDRRTRAVSPNRALARLAGIVSGAFRAHTVASAVDARVEILPHQLEPALAVLHGARRVLIADEVGLGKTIQAGFVIAEILRRRVAARILILAPAALADQWQHELDRRFAIDGVRVDRGALEARAREIASGDSPWRRAGVWLASIDYVKQPHVLEALPPDPWDLVVVDEAHTACGASDRHEACRRITAAARAVLLLTATPHDGDEARFQRLLNLGALSDIDDALTVFRRSRRDLLASPPRRVRWQRVRLSEAERALLDALGEFERAVLRVAADERRDAALLLLSIFRKRALSTMGALACSLRRRLAWIERSEGPATTTAPQQYSLAFDDADVVTADEAAGLMADVGFDGGRERAWLKRLLALADAARRHERKVARVAAFVTRAREPIVVFTEFRDSLEVLRRRLERRVATSCLHGGLSAGERRAELARFLDGATSVLVATDVASLGLNLQSRARSVVNLDLPWNPARLEQRAGRVDRIGQTRRVLVSLIVADHGAEAPVLIRLARRVLAAERSTGSDLGSAAAFRELDVRAGVFLDQPVSTEGAVASWHPTARWSRPARCAATRLARCRALRRRWRGPADDGARPLRSRVDRFPRLRALAGDTILIFVVPCVDGAGSIVERHVVAVANHTPPTIPGDARTMMERAAREAMRALRPRARRLARLSETNAREAVALERSLAAGLVASYEAGDAQPGLFDRREHRSFEQRRAVVETIERGADVRIAGITARARVEIGRPSLVLVLRTRP